MKIIITGSCGLIGSEAVWSFTNKNHDVIGIDNNMRKTFFGILGDTEQVKLKMTKDISNYEHHDLDIRERKNILDLIKKESPDIIIHTAAQPSHDYAAKIPFDDFDINAVGTLNLLEGLRRYNPNGIFIHMSTNKVYGDRPNKIRLKELEKRYDYDDKKYLNGIPENFSIDQSKHSLFGASKISADILVQEYGRYFGINSCVLRGGCLTGPKHSGVELHGFFNYLVKANLEEIEYTIYGYHGKQVRDNIHSNDVVTFMEEFIKKPRVAEVYNIGGGKSNSCSILEAFELIENRTGKNFKYKYNNQNRLGDHICYYSDLSKIKSHYPEWNIKFDLKMIIDDIVSALCN